MFITKRKTGYFLEEVIAQNKKRKKISVPITEISDSVEITEKFNQLRNRVIMFLCWLFCSY